VWNAFNRVNGNINNCNVSRVPEYFASFVVWVNIVVLASVHSGFLVFV